VVAVQDQKLQNQYLLSKEEELHKDQKKTKGNQEDSSKNSITTERNRSLGTVEAILKGKNQA
jgi:hypothetical protein